METDKMAKSNQILVIDPVSELKFIGPFTSTVTSYITLSNPSQYTLCYKIKTTAPKKYCVRPNSGTLYPSKTVKIAVVLQPFDYDPNEKNKHKFMVQSIIAPPSDDFNPESLWKEASPDHLMDWKLKCAFEMPDGFADSSVPVTTQFSDDEEDAKNEDNTSSLNTADFSLSEIKKASTEIARLKGELSSAQRENLQLKEDLLKVGQPPLQKMQSTFSHRPTQQAFAENSQIISFIYLACGVIIGLMSILLGKYIF